jgi:hypothetical protein
MTSRITKKTSLQFVGFFSYTAAVKTGWNYVGRCNSAQESTNTMSGGPEVAWPMTGERLACMVELMMTNLGGRCSDQT